MKINLLLNPANRSWIIEKIADKLALEALRAGVETTTTDKPDPSADLVHHMSWAFANVRTAQPSTMFITHLDDIYKIGQVRSILGQAVRVGVCMSNDTREQLIAHGCRPSTLFVINPAHDGAVKPRRIVVGITSRVYPDGRKREAVLVEVARKMDLSSFLFRIFGSGWDPTVAILRTAGAEVEYFNETSDFRQDYEVLRLAVPYFDYYLYLGMDEGSLGTLDALSAGIPTIVTPQGFHLDLPDGITHSVLTAADLQCAFEKILAERDARVASVSGLSWARYAGEHLRLWKSIIIDAPMPGMLVGGAGESHRGKEMRELRGQMLRTNSQSPRRILAALSHLPAMRMVRRTIDQFRSIGK